MEVNAAIQETSDRRLVDGKQRASVWLGLGSLFGTLIAALPRHSHDLEVIRCIQFGNCLFDECIKYLSAATWFPRHDQLRSITW